MTDPLRVTPPAAAPQFASEAERQTALRDEIARKNREALLRLVAKHDLWIQKDDFDNWRPTLRVSGDIVGVKDGLEIIATDGNLAYFLPSDDFDVFFGHIQTFTGEVRTLYAMPREGLVKPAVAKREKRTTRDAMDLLQETRARFAQGEPSAQWKQIT